MLKIRLQRVGRVHEPSFRLVLTDSQNSTKSGLFKEILGSYDPRKSIDSFNSERIQYWLSQGVVPTDTVNNLLIKHGIIRGKKIDVSAKVKKVSASKETTTDKPEVKADAEEVVAPKESVESDTIEEKVAPTPAENKVEAPIEKPAVEEKTV